MEYVNMDNMTDDDFEAAMNAAIYNEDTSSGEEAIVDEDNKEPNVDETTSEPDSEASIDNEEEVNIDENNSVVDDNEENLKDNDNEDELEQSIENDIDSNDDNADDDNEDNKDESNSSDEDATVDENQENVADSDEEQIDDTEESETKSEEKVQTRKLRADGIDYELTESERDSLAEKGINYTKKMQRIAPWRKTISALESEKMTHEDVSLMIDAFKGDKDAISSILKRTGVEAIDLDTENEAEFKPNNYGKSPSLLDIEEITRSISSDAEYGVTSNVINNQWDDKSRDAIFDNPNIISLLHVDVKSGLFDKISPVASSMKILDEANGVNVKSDIEYYKLAGSRVIRNIENEESAKESITRDKLEKETSLNKEAKAKADRLSKAKADEKKRADKRNADNKKSKAGTATSSAGTKTVIDYLDSDGMSDEDFLKIMDREIHRKK